MMNLEQNYQKVPIFLRPIINKIASQFKLGSLSYRLPSGFEGKISGKLSGPDANIVLHSWRPIFRLFFNGSIGFAEGYLAGEWDSSNLPTFIELVTKNSIHSENQGQLLLRKYNWFRHLINNNTRLGSKKNIAFHYDLGNEFYSYWLDNSMTYSSAIEIKNSQNLEDAQQKKYSRILKSLEIKEDQHILEVGCGWGGFAIFAAKEGFKVTGLTISNEQFNYANQLVGKLGLREKVSIKLCDYRDFSSKFDHIASIEMIEAVGENYWPKYFQSISQNLKKGGRFALQAITVRDEKFEIYRKQPDFIQKYIFPGGMLPCQRSIKDNCNEVGMNIISDKGFGKDYASTLAIWRTSFHNAWPKIKSLGFDTRFKRLWSFYLASCEGSFRGEGIDVRQIIMENN